MLTLFEYSNPDFQCEVPKVQCEVPLLNITKSDPSLSSSYWLMCFFSEVNYHGLLWC